MVVAAGLGARRHAGGWLKGLPWDSTVAPLAPFLHSLCCCWHCPAWHGAPGAFAVEMGMEAQAGVGSGGRMGHPALGSTVPLRRGTKMRLQWRGTSEPCPWGWSRTASSPHAALTLPAALQPLAVQLQQELPARHHQPAGVPGAADHHALPR